MSLLKNIQFQQLINLLLLIYLAYTNGNLQTNWFTIFYLMLFSGALELLLKKRIYIPFSAFITALGVVLMVGWTRWYIPLVVISLAIMQKQYLKVANKHIFNPSNLALILAIFIFYPKALPIVGELGKESFIIYIIITIGISILIRADRYLITISFLIFYIGLSWLVFANSDPYWSSEHFISSLYSTSFIVYIFFMLTDPITTPKKAIYQIVFGLTVAFVIVALNYFIGVRLWHIFISLIVTTLLFIPLCRDLKESEIKKFYITTVAILLIVIYISTLKPQYFSM